MPNRLPRVRLNSRLRNDSLLHEEMAVAVDVVALLVAVGVGAAGAGASPSTTGLVPLHRAMDPLLVEAAEAVVPLDVVEQAVAAEQQPAQQDRLLQPSNSQPSNKVVVSLLQRSPVSASFSRILERAIARIASLHMFEVDTLPWPRWASGHLWKAQAPPSLRPLSVFPARQFSCHAL